MVNNKFCYYLLLILTTGNSLSAVSCRVNSLAGELPESVCQMRDFLKAFNAQTAPFPGKNVILIYGELGTGKTTAAEAIAIEADVIKYYYDLEPMLFEK